MTHHRSRYGLVDRNHPEAAGVCDRGGEVRKRRELFPEMAYSGGRLSPTGFLSCLQHMDVPNPQFGGQRALRPDPAPVRNPRPPDGAAGPLPPPYAVQPQTLHDTRGNLLLDCAFDPLLDLPAFEARLGSAADAAGAPLFDDNGNLIATG